VTIIMVGMYRIENTTSEHATVLKYTVLGWGERQPDVYLVSKEGVKVYTQRILLSFYSKMVGEMLEENKDDLAGLSIPASSSSLTMMLKVLVSGSVIGRNKDDLLEVGQAAEALGIVLNDRQIGYRKSNATKGVVGKGDMKESVEISGRKVSYRKSVESSAEIKTEPIEENEIDMAPSLNSSVDLNVFSKMKKNKKLKNSEVVEADKVDDKTCIQCGKVFPSAGKLKLHMNVHKDEKERPFKCDVCEKGFSAPASLKNHKLMHTGEAFKCEFCSYTAVQKGNLKTHRFKLHKDLLEIDVMNSVEQKDMLDTISDVNVDVDEVVQTKEKEEVQKDSVPEGYVVETEPSENVKTDASEGCDGDSNVEQEEKIVGVE